MAIFDYCNVAGMPFCITILLGATILFGRRAAAVMGHQLALARRLNFLGPPHRLPDAE